MSIRRPTFHLIMSATVLAMVSVSAADEPANGPTLERLIVQLGAPDYFEREDATRHLMTRDDLDDATLEAAFRSARNPEVRHRLTRIALHRFYRRIRIPPDASGRAVLNPKDSGGLGVDLQGNAARIVRPVQNPLLQNPAILITITMPGFPAYAYLRPGDLIVGAGKDEFNEEKDYFADGLDYSVFTAKIKSLTPGEIMVLRVLRNERMMTIRFPIDSLDRLHFVYPSPQDEKWAMARTDFQEHLQSLTGDSAIAELNFPTPDTPQPTPTHDDRNAAADTDLSR